MFRNPKTKYLLLDLTLAIAVAIAGGVFAGQLFDALGDDSLEWRFSVVLTAFPSPVMFAAGRGMNNIDVNSIPELKAFYRNEVSSFDPALIPADYEGFPLSGSYNYMHFYLLYAIGWAWRLFGISFHSIHLLCIFLYMLMIGILYGVFRLGMGRPLSLIGALIAAASPAYLLSCPSLRDFGKAPFILLCFLLLGVLLKQRHSKRSLLLYGLFYGVVAGIGYGFRQDLLICVPAAIVTLVLFVRVDDAHPRLIRIAASVVLLVAFLVVGFPVLYGVHLDKGSASAQAFTQGVSEIMEDRMDFGYASYTMHHHYSDYFDFTVVNNYGRRIGYTAPMPGHFSAGHGEAGSKLMRETMRQFPADMFARGLASLVALSGVNATATEEASRITQPHGDMLRERAALYDPFSEHFEKWGLVYALVALVVLSISNIRLGIAAAFLCIYFGAYPSLLYEFRHFFHLAFVPYWAVGYLVSKAWGLVYGVSRNLYKKDFETLRSGFRPRKIIIGLGFVVIVIAALGFTLVTLRIVQKNHMDPLLIRYANAVLTPVETMWTQADNNVLLRPIHPLPGLEATATLPAFESTGEYLALSLKNVGYPLHFRILYEELPLVDFSQWSTPRPGLIGKGGNYTFFFPVYQLVWPKGDDVVRGDFKGLLIPEQYRHAVKGLYRVKNSDEFSLWPFLALAKHKGAFQTTKTGPFERFFAAAWVEIHSLFGWRCHSALAGYRQLIRRYPGYAPFEDRALAHIRHHSDPEEALKLWGSILEDFPQLYPKASADIEAVMKQVEGGGGAVSLHTPKDPWTLTQRGLQLEKEGKHDEAAELYRAALNEAPTLIFAAENLDNYLRQHQNAEARLSEWGRLKERYPRAMLPALFYGMALRGAGRLDEALACFDEITETYPVYRDDARLQLAATEIMRGQWDAGVATVNEILKVHPEKKKTVATLYSEAGQYFMEQQDYATAIKLFAMACSLDGDDLWPCVSHADALATAGQTEQAKAAYLEVLTVAPESPYTAFNLDALYDMGERVALWQGVHDTHPTAAIPLLYLGKAQEAAGDTESARISYQEAVQIDPALADAQNGIARLTATDAPEGQ